MTDELELPEPVETSPLVEALADAGPAAARLVELHRDNGAGRCWVCRAGRHDTPHQVFPCRIRSLATRALHLQARRAGKRHQEKPAPGPLF